MRKSFTLIEVVFAVGIILIFLGSLIAIFNIGSRNVLVSAHRLQAANLARGAAEIAREVRDTAKSNSIPWSGAPGTVNMDNDCWLPPDQDSYPLANCSAPGYLGIKTGTEPPDTSCPPTCNGVLFKRKINITRSGDVRKITATVSWNDYGQPHSVVVVTYLTNY